MLRSPFVLAALADATVPRLMPRSVAGVTVHLGDRFQEAVVKGADEQEWTVRVSRTPAAAAEAEHADAFLDLLAKRVPFEVPRTTGRIGLPDRNTVSVHPRLPGTAMSWRHLRGGSPQARSLGEALAALHDVDPRTAEEAGLPVYDAESYRSRRLALLDRAAGTGMVPSGLLGRWERALEDVALWRFSTCLTHGVLEGHHVFADDHVRAMSDWEGASVADPATDFAAVVALAPADAVDTVLEVYSAHRAEAPDKHLERRARLAGELQRVVALLDAVAAGDDRLVDRRTAALRRLDEATVDDESLLPRAPKPPAATVVSADDLDDDVSDDTDARPTVDASEEPTDALDLSDGAPTQDAEESDDVTDGPQDAADDTASSDDDDEFEHESADTLPMPTERRDDD